MHSFGLIAPDHGAGQSLLISFSGSALQQCAAPGDFPVALFGDGFGIHGDHQMQVIAHHRITVYRHRKQLTEFQYPRFYPASPMFEVLPADWASTAQEQLLHAAYDQVEVAELAGLDDQGAGGCHGLSMRQTVSPVCRRFPRRV